ncbi:hypothetical protein J1F62_29585 (plasmid) [Klebsiella michiganensis]|uniref:hypothetical protein n=1 Tax=Klebsiella michiganensis TaxID=1134687 RepID=UPI001A91A382|nr:hypothetical protein [Klebsiella michiganensis]QSW17648.1 hypothetical protein J1F62_29585 [Klebsiella michiganensis]
MKKMVLLLIVQAISCLIDRWDLPSTLFVTLTLAIWFLIFYCVFFKIRKSKSIGEANGKFRLYLLGVCISAFFSPIICLFFCLIYPLFAMNKYYRFMAFHKKRGFKKTGYDSGMDALNQVSTTPYSGSFEQRGNCFESHHSLDTSSSINTEVDIYKDFGGQVDTSSTTFTDVNPTSGLPMIGNVDVAGNPYGIDRHD